MFFVRLVEPVQLYHTTVPGTAAATLVRMLYTCIHIRVYMFELCCARTCSWSARFDIRRVTSGADLVVDAPYTYLVPNIES